jgi:beta-lactam-binding protein with PASTA domain
MITPAGAVKVMDFGIARAVADNSATVTQTANVIGTAQYLSPEQARGETVDARSDVYSTGCLFYELVTGVPPFQGDSPVAVAYQHVRENPVVPSARVPDIPRVIDSIVMKALAKNQLNRYQSAGDMRQDLQRALADQPVSAEAVMTDAERTQFIARTPPPPIALRRADYAEPVEEDHRRTGLIWAAVVVALLLVIGVAAYAIVFLGKDKASAKTVAVPSVIGQTEASATTALRNAGLTPSKGAATGGPCAGGQTVQEGQICTLEPPAGHKVAQNSTVTYHLYSPKTVQVPFVEGETFAQAVSDLHAHQLQAKRNNVNNKAPAGTVLRQHTAQFTPVPPNSVVVLDVSTGQLKLQDVRGKTFDDAQNLLSPSFPNVVQGDPVITSDPTKNGKVANESPSPNNTYDPDQQITLRVYQYQAPVTTSCPASPTGTGTGIPTGGPTPTGGAPSTPVGSTPTC